MSGPHRSADRPSPPSPHPAVQTGRVYPSEHVPGNNPQMQAALKHNFLVLGLSDAFTLFSILPLGPRAFELGAVVHPCPHTEGKGPCTPLDYAVRPVLNCPDTAHRSHGQTSVCRELGATTSLGNRRPLPCSLPPAQLGHWSHMSVRKTSTGKLWSSIP